MNRTPPGSQPSSSPRRTASCPSTLCDGPATEDGKYLSALTHIRARCASAQLSADTDPLSAYLTRLNYLVPLPADVQQQLAEHYRRTGDPNAAHLLVLTNLRLVVKLAKEYQRRKTDLLELIQQGNLGLSEALIRYDPYRGVRFTSYAQYWIRAMILNYLMNHTHPVRIGGSRAGRKLFYNLKKARRALMQDGQQPTAAQVAEYLGVSEDEVMRIAAQIDAPPVYLDAEAPGHDDITLGEMMPAETPDPETRAIHQDLADQLRRCIQEFGDAIGDPRRTAIWQQRMIAEEPCTLAELGSAWQVSKERIRQLEVGMRQEFRLFLSERLGDEVKMEWLQTSCPG